MKRPYELTAVFRHKGSLEAIALLQELATFCRVLGDQSPELSTWYLKGDSKEEATRYEVFDANGPTTAATAVVTEELRKEVDPRIIGIWNGKTDANGASLQIIARPGPETSTAILRVKPGAFPQAYEGAVAIVQAAALQWQACAITLESGGYFPLKVFKDRPGVGWMIYLPKTLTVQQVPEAGALISVMDGKKQIGTIVVSVTDAPFSDADPEHVRIANKIEVRLVDQDLLPRVAEL